MGENVELNLLISNLVVLCQHTLEIGTQTYAAPMSQGRTCSWCTDCLQDDRPVQTRPCVTSRKCRAFPYND